MELERREQVFVSSTFLDLQDERQEVIQTLLEADCIPAGMELFPASDDDRWSLIKRIIDDCDYYVVVVGGRYGSIDQDRGLSYTEMEYEYAVEIGLPVMGFLHGQPESIEVSKSELDADVREKLSDFRSKVEQRMVKYWTTPQELAGQVAKSLIQTRKTHPAEGWVRARNALTSETTKELSDLRSTAAELRMELEKERHAVPDDIEDLEQGEDLYSYGCVFRYWTQEDVDEETTYQNRTVTVRPAVNVSWDDIFAFIAPSFMDECSETDFEARLDALAYDLFVRGEGDLPDGYGRVRSIEAQSENLDDVKVQLFALNLIVHSERRRAVSDKNTYWALTPRGRDHLMRLRARRRTKPTPSDVTATEGPSADGQASKQKPAKRAATKKRTSEKKPASKRAPTSKK